VPHTISQAKFVIILVCPVGVEVGNPLFWKNRSIDFPVLSHVARKYLSVNALSVAVESMYSITGLIMNSRRSRLQPCKLNNIGLCFIHDNAECWTWWILNCCSTYYSFTWLWLRYNLKCIKTLYRNFRLLLVHLTRLQTNDWEKENIWKIQITTVSSKIK